MRSVSSPNLNGDPEDHHPPNNRVGTTQFPCRKEAGEHLLEKMINPEAERKEEAHSSYVWTK